MTYLFPLGLAIGCVAAGVYALYLTAAHGHTWKRVPETVVCPRDGNAADVVVERGPDRWELLVTSNPPERACVTRCSRFGNGPVRCAQGCLAP